MKSINSWFLRYVWHLTRSAAPSPVFEDGVKERGSGSTLSKARHLGRGVEGLTSRKPRVTRILRETHSLRGSPHA